MFLINLNDFISYSLSTKYIIKILQCPILESNSGPLDPKPDTLPVELSRRSTLIVHYIDNLTTARMSDNTRISNRKNFYFN